MNFPLYHLRKHDVWFLHSWCVKSFYSLVKVLCFQISLVKHICGMIFWDHVNIYSTVSFHPVILAYSTRLLLCSVKYKCSKYLPSTNYFISSKTEIACSSYKIYGKLVRSTVVLLAPVQIHFTHIYKLYLSWNLDHAYINWPWGEPHGAFLLMF